MLIQDFGAVEVEVAPCENLVVRCPVEPKDCLRGVLACLCRLLPRLFTLVVFPCPPLVLLAARRSFLVDWC